MSIDDGGKKKVRKQKALARKRKSTTQNKLIVSMSNGF